MIDYDPHDWRSHFFDYRGSLLPEIVGRTALCVLWSAAVVVLHEWYPLLGVPATVHAMTGFALGLLLVIRTNSSYDRFWEGRKLWGSIINDTRNLGRLASSSLRNDPDLLRQILLWTMAFPVASMNVLRGQCGIGKFESQLPVDEVRQVVGSNHCALAVARQITRLLIDARNRGVLSEYLFVALDNNVQLLVQYVGGCERIHRTPLPFAYVVHLRRAVLFYCYTLPFGLVRDFEWWTIVATLLVAYIFFGIEEIGVEIEDPFGSDENDLPLERFCDTIQRNLSEMLPGGEAIGGDAAGADANGQSCGIPASDRAG
jgi:ion channel-forming bestrophin family protein